MGAALQLIENDSLKISADGYQIAVHLNWYRTLPASCVHNLTLSVDGQPVPVEQISFEVNGKKFSLAELEDQVEEFWFVQDSAFVHVNQPGKLADGKPHTVHAEMALRFPYIAIGPGRFLTNTSRCTLSMTARS